MIRDRIERFKDGWFLGNFEPTIKRTGDFEVAYKRHLAGENWPNHYQIRATEYNVLIHGSLAIDAHTFTDGDIFIIEPYEQVKPHFITDCELIVVKTPSIPGDKVECSP